MHVFILAVQTAPLCQCHSKNKMVFKRWMFLHPVPGLMCHWHAQWSLPHLLQINSPSKQRKYCSHTHSYTRSAREALSTMFLSRFPSLSTHKAWERHKEEADAGARGSLELFWRVKVKEMRHATWAKTSSLSSFCLYRAMSSSIHKTMVERKGAYCFCRAATDW